MGLAVKKIKVIEVQVKKGLSVRIAAETGLLLKIQGIMVSLNEKPLWKILKLTYEGNLARIKTLYSITVRILALGLLEITNLMIDIFM